MLGQTFAIGDLGVVLILIGLEGLLSADNALVLAIMVRHLPKDQQRRALLYGLGGAFVFRLIAIVLASKILALWWLQAVGAAYLLFLPLKHFLSRSHGGGDEAKNAGKAFWPTVVAVEVADIAFALDSVLAGVAMVRGQDKIWVVYFGAIIGVVLLRFAASFFVKLLDQFPDLDHVAYLLVGWVGVKLGFMAVHNYGINAKLPAVTAELPPLVFWSVLLGIAAIGSWFAYLRRDKDESAETEEEILLEESAESIESAFRSASDENTIR